ncbi:MAG: hypothetical protein P8Y45_20635 [Exilibacterium sp.]
MGENEFEGEVVAEVGNYDRRQVRGSVNILLVEDVRATRLSFNTTRRDGVSEHRCEQVRVKVHMGSGISTNRWVYFRL